MNGALLREVFDYTEMVQRTLRKGIRSKLETTWNLCALDMQSNIGHFSLRGDMHTCAKRLGWNDSERRPAPFNLHSQ